MDESRTHFSIWAAMKAPLILGNNLNDMSKDLYDIVTNRNVIAVNVSEPSPLKKVALILGLLVSKIL